MPDQASSDEVFIKVCGAEDAALDMSSEVGKINQGFSHDRDGTDRTASEAISTVVESCGVVVAEEVQHACPDVTGNTEDSNWSAVRRWNK